MQVGDLVQGRFEISRLAGVGGMGTVYQARDVQTGQIVALKCLSMDQQSDVDRFIREARLLAELSHPGIVRYVAHGITTEQQPFLVMEWLEGEDLSRRLRKEGMSPEQSVGLVLRVCRALEAAHARGIIHRDIKPGNIFLVGGDLEQIKLLDFGVALPMAATRALTVTGSLVGTIGYMAPEQARGDRDIDARADIFSLGCVLFECLTGQPPFTGTQPVAVMAKVLMEEAPRVRELCPELSEPLERMVARMLAKSRTDRPPDCQTLVEELEGLGELATVSCPTPVHHSRVLTEEEQRLLSIILVADHQPTRDTSLEPTMKPEEQKMAMDPVMSAVRPLGGEVTLMASGIVLVMLKHKGRIIDQASRAALCAISVRDVLPRANVALATGGAEVTGPWPVGDVIDRAASLLGDALDAGITGIVVDELTGDLLDGSFVLRGDSPRQLVSPRRGRPAGRLLLGKPTPFVGRNKEMAIMEAILNECTQEKTSQAVLVVSSPGVGKSRLCQEFVDCVSDRDDLLVLEARGDPVYSGSSFSMVAQLVRQACGVHEYDEGGEQYREIQRFVKALPFDGDPRDLTEAMGEVINAPSLHPPSARLAEAREDMVKMSRLLLDSLLTFFSLLCAAGPVLVIVDDLHLGDIASVTLLGNALKRFSERPFMVLALARPEVDDHFLGLWPDVDLQRIQLGPLRKRSVESFVRSVVGESLDAGVLEAICQQSGGNAFFLEELIRHVASGDDSEFPSTVLAVAQSRLERLEEPARRILRAASVFGESFWISGVRSLIGGAIPPAEQVQWFDLLVEKEILSPMQDSRFADEREMKFSHGILREAAYAMLTTSDRRLGHRLAGEWLERRGEKEHRVLADHFTRGEARERAIPHLVRASRSAFFGRSYEEALALAQRGLEFGAKGRERADLQMCKASASWWLQDIASLADDATAAINSVQSQHMEWYEMFETFSTLLSAAAFDGSPAELLASLSARSRLGDPAPVGPTGAVLWMLYVGLVNMGKQEDAQALKHKFERAVEADPSRNPVFAGWLQLTRAFASNNGFEPIGLSVPSARRAMELFGEARDDRGRGSAAFSLGIGLVEVGRFEEAEKLCRQALSMMPEGAQTAPIRAFTSWVLGSALAMRANVDEAHRILDPVATAGQTWPCMMSRTTLALGNLIAGERDRAQEIASEVVRCATIMPQIRGSALAILADVELEHSRPEKAMEYSIEGLSLRKRAGMRPVFESLLRLSLARAHHALGEQTQAAACIWEARDWLRVQSASIEDATLRQAFLGRVYPNAHIGPLAEKLLT